MHLINKNFSGLALEAKSGWHAIYTRHQHEKVIARLLSEKGFEVFLPLYNVARRWKDRTRRLSLPLFPCYLFVWTGVERRREIVTTPGFYSFVGAGDRPALIPREEIEAVRRVLARGAAVEPCPYLRCGDWVRITSGPLEGIEGILSRKKNLFRLILSVELLEKSVAVEVDACLVERVNGRQGAARSAWAGAAAHI